jgi:hypothetical protein
MRIHEEVRQALARGLHGDALLGITGRLALARDDGNGDTLRPIVRHTILTVLEGAWRRWFNESFALTVEMAEMLDARLIPAVEALLVADASGEVSEILAALDGLAGAYRGCVKEFPA